MGKFDLAILDIKGRKKGSYLITDEWEGETRNTAEK